MYKKAFFKILFFFHFWSISVKNVYLSGHAEESINGVAIIVPKKFQNFVCGYYAVNDKIFTSVSKVQHAFCT